VRQFLIRLDSKADGLCKRQFEYIYENTRSEYPGVGVLTASNRDVWAKVGETTFSS
jgi:hypothetical protein